MGVIAGSTSDEERAAQIARRFDVPLLDSMCSPRGLPERRAVVQVIDGIPGIQLTGRDVPGAVTIDFADKSLAHRRRAGHNELLGKAVGWKQARAPRVLDATGGYGRDAFLLADLGCTVDVCERDPIMGLLFQEALSRGLASTDEWLVSVLARIRLHNEDAQTLDLSALGGVDVIYLDPMFPLDRRAAPAKEMQILHLLLASEDREPVAESEDALAGDHDHTREQQDAALLAWARAQEVQRVVVKRPRRAPEIGGPAPGHSLTGKAVRFDVYPVSREGSN
ncbi:class I SAM-dependent methyltransferase [Congregibacter sp.]|uniref:class I SAM-dependent methyltransferase n=1 Tax=Congregibacter sp. TaxID=2744308 RepID=UPI003F6CD988